MGKRERETAIKFVGDEGTKKGDEGTKKGDKGEDKREDERGEKEM